MPVRTSEGVGNILCSILKPDMQFCLPVVLP